METGHEIRAIEAEHVSSVVRELCMEICYKVPPEMVELMRLAREREESPIGRQILDQLLLSQDIAAEGEYPDVPHLFADAWIGSPAICEVSAHSD